MSSEKSRREFLKYVVTGVVCGVVAGVGGWFAGSAIVPPPKTITKTITETITKTVTVTPKPPVRPVKIGLVVSLSGAEALYGITSLDGVMMALEEINAAGGILGQPAEVIYYDDGGDPKEAVIVARKLVYEDKVPVGLSGTGSETTLPMAPVWDEGKTPLLTVWAGHPDITKSPYVFRFDISTDIVGRGLAKFAYENLGKRYAAVIYNAEDPWDLEQRNAFVDQFQRYGGEIVYEKIIGEGEVEYVPILTEIQATKADFIYFTHGYVEAAALISQARGMGIMLPIIHNVNGETEEIIKAAGKAIEQDYYLHTRMVWGIPSTEKFLETYRKKWGREPMGFTSPACYDAMFLIADVIERAGSLDREAIREALAKTKKWKGKIVGTVEEFTPRGEIILEMNIARVVEGKFKQYTTISTKEFYQ